LPTLITIKLLIAYPSYALKPSLSLKLDSFNRHI